MPRFEVFSDTEEFGVVEADNSFAAKNQIADTRCPDDVVRDVFFATLRVNREGRERDAYRGDR